MKAVKVVFAVLALALATCGDEITHIYGPEDPGGNSGAIAGWVIPPTSGVSVSADGSDSITYSNAVGYFLLEGLAPGVYDLAVRSDTYSRRWLRGILVEAREITVLDEVRLSQYPYPVFVRYQHVAQFLIVGRNTIAHLRGYVLDYRPPDGRQGQLVYSGYRMFHLHG